MINFIPNDPLAVDVLPMREVKARPERGAGTAGITVAGNAPEGRFDLGEPGFVAWQARQAAILAIEAWEEVRGAPLASWAQESANPASLMLVPDAGEDLNAYYDRESLSFFHKTKGRKTWWSGASTDVVAHETGHGILDALRPDLWSVNMLEIGGFHEAFGDVTAIIAALADRATREALLTLSPDLATANFVEATAEDLSDAIRRVLGARHPAAKPRRALNTFRWQLPQTMPSSGGPDVMIGEVHSIARIMTGCFYDVLRAIFTASGQGSQEQLWAATETTGHLFYEAARTAPAVPRFFRAIGRAMVLADQTLNGGAHRQLIGKAFFGHGLALGAQGFLAPELALAGKSPRMLRNAMHLEPATISDLRQRVGAGSRAAADVNPVEFGGETFATVAIRDQVSLDAVDSRLRGVVAAVDSVALVGQSGGAAALMAAPRAGAASAEVLDFVSSLVAHGQVEFAEPTKPPTKRAAAIGTAKQPETTAGAATHAVKRRGRKQKLERVRFACAES
jgi:Fungalysin metallopeptidase (M36)